LVENLFFNSTLGLFVDNSHPPKKPLGLRRTQMDPRMRGRQQLQKKSSIVTLYNKYTRTVTFEIFFCSSRMVRGAWFLLLD
jgi:hypothetical protein